MHSTLLGVTGIKLISSLRWTHSIPSQGAVSFAQPLYLAFLQGTCSSTTAAMVPTLLHRCVQQDFCYPEMKQCGIAQSWACLWRSSMFTERFSASSFSWRQHAILSPTTMDVACSVAQVCGAGSNSPVSSEKLLHKKNCCSLLKNCSTLTKKNIKS